MNIKRSYFKLLMASAGVGLFLANCTVKSSSDESCEKGDKAVGCDCPGSLTGHQVCDSDGVFGACVCPDDNSGAGTKNSSTAGTSTDEGGAPASTGGKSGNTAGTDSGGVAPVAGGAGGAGGEGGAGPVVFPTYNTCEDCLLDLCQAEMDACLADEQCFSAAADGSGEYEAISECIEAERAKGGVAKRDAVRGCGVTLGLSSNPDLASDWAPQGMAPATTNLLNCLATSSSETPNADWANDPANFPNDVPTAWPEDSCAKLACTSAK